MNAIVRKHLGEDAEFFYNRNAGTGITDQQLVFLKTRLTEVITQLDKSISQTSEQNPDIKSAKQRMAVINNELAEIAEKSTQLSRKNTADVIKEKTTLLQRKEILTNEKRVLHQKLMIIAEKNKEHILDRLELNNVLQKINQTLSGEPDLGDAFQNICSNYTPS